MNPVIATGLINIGGNLLRQALPPGSDSSSTTKANFEKDLVEFQNRDAGKIENLDQLRSDLIKCPEVNEFLSKNTDCSITLDQFSDGSIRILSSSGDFMTLHPNTSTCKLASQFLQGSIASGKNLHPQRANSVILTG